MILLSIVSLVIVAITAYSVGKDNGIEQGRMEILKENEIRANVVQPCPNYLELSAVLDSIKEPTQQPY